MFLCLLMFLFSNISHAELNSKYKEAVKVSTNAALKQSGLEGDFFTVRKATEKAAKKWARENHLEIPLTVISFVAPVVYKQKLKVKSGDFTFNLTTDKLAVDWAFSF